MFSGLEIRKKSLQILDENQDITKEVTLVVSVVSRHSPELEPCATAATRLLSTEEEEPPALNFHLSSTLAPHPLFNNRDI